MESCADLEDSTAESAGIAVFTRTRGSAGTYTCEKVYNCWHEVHSCSFAGWNILVLMLVVLNRKYHIIVCMDELPGMVLGICRVHNKLPDVILNTGIRQQENRRTSLVCRWIVADNCSVPVIRMLSWQSST